MLLLSTCVSIDMDLSKESYGYVELLLMRLQCSLERMNKSMAASPYLCPSDPLVL